MAMLDASPSLNFSGTLGHVRSSSNFGASAAKALCHSAKTQTVSINRKYLFLNNFYREADTLIMSLTDAREFTRREYAKRQRLHLARSEREQVAILGDERIGAAVAR